MKYCNLQYLKKTHLVNRKKKEEEKKCLANKKHIFEFEKEDYGG
jgi:hypothetical protein